MNSSFKGSDEPLVPETASENKIFFPSSGGVAAKIVAAQIQTNEKTGIVAFHAIPIAVWDSRVKPTGVVGMKIGNERGKQPNRSKADQYITMLDERGIKSLRCLEIQPRLRRIRAGITPNLNG